MNNLKPCPHEGGEPSKHRRKTYRGSEGFFVQCVCGISGPCRDTIKRAEQGWNYRPVEDALTARVNELESFIGTIGPCGLAKEDEK
jgi:hypothetical protein